MPLEDPATIDIVATNTSGQLELIIVDSGITHDPQERLQKLLAKLKTYVNYLLGSDFADDQGLVDASQVVIAIHCQTPPTPQMSAITQVAPRGDHARAIAVKYLMPDGTTVAPAAEPARPEMDPESLLPRLVRPEFFLRFPKENEIPHSMLGCTGLAVVYVLDSEHTVAYVTRSMAEEMSLDDASLHLRAVDNLSERLPRDVVRKVLDERWMPLIQTGDTFDAARILVVPRHLEAGEAIAAAIPDRDSLILGPVPGNNDWSGYTEMARTPGGDQLLLDKALKVTHDGIELVTE